MKVLNIYKSYYPYTKGGIEKHIQTLSALLQEKNIQSDILTTSTERHVLVRELDKSQVYYFPSTFEIASCPFSMGLLKQFHKIASQYNILLVHFPWPFADLLLSISQIKKPIIVFYHSDIVRQKKLNTLYLPLMHFFLKKANLILTSSENYLNSSQVLQQYKYKTKVVTFSMSNQQVLNDPNRVEYWREQLGTDYFLFVGVLRYYKGLDYLLEAVQGTDIKLVIAGSGPEETYLKGLKAKKQLSNIIFLGQITESDKWILYQLCKATVFPSHLRAEAFCISILESLMLGKPIISTELGTGTSFVNKHNVSGLVVPPADPIALKKAMLNLLNDHHLYETLIQGTKQHYLDYFTPEKMQDNYLSILKTIQDENYR